MRGQVEQITKRNEIFVKNRNNLMKNYIFFVF